MDRTTLSVIIAISMLFYVIGVPLAGRLLDWLGTRTVLLIGVALVLLSIIWTYFSHGVLSFAIAYGGLLSLGLSFTSPIAVTSVVSRWFTRQRGKALFFLSTGSMAGIAVMTPIFTLFIDLIGWRNTLLLLAGIFIVIAVPSAIFVIRDEVPEGGDMLPGNQAGLSGSVSDCIPRQNMLGLIYFVRGLGFLGLVLAFTPVILGGCNQWFGLGR